MQHRQCSAPACLRSRRKFGRFCPIHARRLNHHGSPVGRPIHVGKLTPIALRVLQLFAAHPDHPGLLLACGELDALLKDSARRAEDGEHLTADSRHFAQLAAHGVTAPYILAMLTAVLLYDEETPGAVPDTNALRFAIARAVGSLASHIPGIRRKPLGARALGEIGGLLLERYAGIAAAVLSHYRALERAKETRAQTLRHPFGSNDTVA